MNSKVNDIQINVTGTALILLDDGNVFMANTVFETGSLGEPREQPWLDLIYGIADFHVNQSRELHQEIGRLQNTLNDRSMNANDKVLASDSYYHIAELLGVPSGGSVCGTVQTMRDELERLKDEANTE